MTSVLYSGTEDRSICPSQVVALRYLCWLLYLNSASYFILVAVYLFICPHPVVPMSPPSQIPPTSLAHPDPVSSVGSHCKQLFGKSEYICLWILNCCSFTTAASLTQHEPVQVDIKKSQEETLQYLKLCTNGREQKAMLAPQRQQQYYWLKLLLLALAITILKDKEGGRSVDAAEAVATFMLES